jgi:hypothetical protein
MQQNFKRRSFAKNLNFKNNPEEVNYTIEELVDTKIFFCAPLEPFFYADTKLNAAF